MSVIEGEPPVRLVSGTAEATLLPGQGAALASLTVDGQDLVVPRPAEMVGLLGAGSFALVPWANRIRGGDFIFDGKRHGIRLNFHPETNALHGLGWESIWTVTDEEEASATLVHRHAPDAAWPFAYEAHQRFELDGEGLSTTLTVSNTGAEAMPVSLGFHPYLPAPDGATLTAPAEGVWLTDDSLIPDRLVPAAMLADFGRAQRVDALPFVDNCFTRWSGEALLEVPDLPGIRVRSSAPASFVHIYAPGERFVCVEPVTAMPDAVNRPEPADESGLATLAPGQSMTIAMRIERVLR